MPRSPKRVSFVASGIRAGRACRPGDGPTHGWQYTAWREGYLQGQLERRALWRLFRVFKRLHAGRA